MNRRAAGLVVLAVVAGLSVVGGAYGPAGPLGDGGTADGAEAPRFVHDGERLTLEPATEQTVRGETDLESGTELSVRLRSTGEDPFLKSATATVDDDGAFEATFDMSDVPSGATFEVVVHRDGTRYVNATGEVAA